MRLTYMGRYSWNSTWNKYDRIFAILNVFSVAITILIFVALTGLLYSFKNYTENILNRLPLCVEVFKTRDQFVSDLSSMEGEINNTPGVSAIYKRVPTFLEFVNASGVPVPGSALPKGATILPDEPFVIEGIDGEKIRFLKKNEISSPFDEVGIIVSFDFLRALGYLPETAVVQKPETWKDIELPQRIAVVLESEGRQPTNLPLPVVGVVAKLDRGGYLITEDFYNVKINWHADFQYMLQDRHGKPLVEPPNEITKSYFVLKEEQLFWLEENIELIEEYAGQRDMEVFLDSWETANGLEERLAVASLAGEPLKLDTLKELDRHLRTFPQLANLPQVHVESQREQAKSWSDFPPIRYRHQYMQAAIYLQDRTFIRSVLAKFRSIGLFASSSLERYLKTFERQERFFVGAVIAVFALVTFLSAIVLFSTFYTSVQRKKGQIGILKASGVSGARIAMLFYMESVIICLLGIPLGIFAGMQIGTALSDWINRFAKLSQTQLQFLFPLEYIAIIAASVFAFCGLAIFFPVRMAAKIDPAEVIRG